MRRTTFEAIGTHWDVQVSDALPQVQWADALEQVQACIERFDAAYSRFRSDSLVTVMSQKAGTYPLPEDGYAMLQLYQQLYHATNGKVTPLIGQVMADTGYDAAYSFAPKPLHRPPAWEDVISYDRQHITLARPALLDFGAAGKGYLVDRVATVLRDAGAQSYLINAGGDIVHHAARHKTVNVGLENPFDTAEVIGIATIGNQSLCASAGTKRVWRQFHHILDPDSLRSVQSVAATWVLADDVLTADGLATALFFASPEALQAVCNFSYALLAHDGSLHYAPDFPVKLFEESAR
jgi:thiamine biosynthesis lipoprotein